MEYTEYKTTGGNYLVDWKAVHRIIRGFYLYEMARTEMKIVTIEGQRFGDADLKQINIPWKSIRPKATDRTNATLGILIQSGDIKGLYHLIHNFFSPGFDKNKQVVRDAMSRVQTDNSNTVEKLVAGYGAAVSTAKFVRDTSFTTVCIGATIVGGPAGVALAGLGSGGKGAGKYQDTANIGSALIEVSASFITTIIPIGAAANGVKNSAALDGTLVMVDAVFDTTQNLVEGDSFMRAVTKAGGKQIVGKGLGKLIAIDPGAVGTMMKNSAIPVKGMVILDQINKSNVTGRYAASMMADAASDTATKRIIDLASDDAAKMSAYFTKQAVSTNSADDLDMLRCQLTKAELAIRKSN